MERMAQRSDMMIVMLRVSIEGAAAPSESVWVSTPVLGTLMRISSSAGMRLMI